MHKQSNTGDFSKSPQRQGDLYEAVRALQHEKIKLQSELEQEKTKNKNVLSRIERRLQDLMHDYEEKDKKLRQAEATVSKQSDEIGKLSSQRNEFQVRVSSAQQETAMLKHQLQLKERELAQVRADASKKEKDMLEDIESMRKSEEQRFSNLFKQVTRNSQSSDRTRSDDFLNEDLLHLQHENRSLQSEIDHQRDTYDRSYSQLSLQKDELTSELNRALRQIDNLNLVVETKEQEIAGWEHRFLTLQSGHNQQLETLQIHFENLIRQKLDRELKDLQMNHDKQRNENESNTRLSMMRADESDARLKAQLREKDFQLQQLQQRMAELDYLLPTLSNENSNLQNEMEQLRHNLMNNDSNYKHELLDLKSRSEELQKVAYDQGFQKGQISGDVQYQALQGEYGQLKERFVEACQRIILHQEEVQKLNDVLEEYKTEIENWKRRVNDIQAKAADDMKRLRSEYDAQTQQWLDREMYETNRRHVQERSAMEDRLKDRDKDLARVEQQKRDLEFEIKQLEYQVQQLKSLEQDLEEREREIDMQKRQALGLQERMHQEAHAHNVDQQKQLMAHESARKDLERLNRKLQGDIDMMTHELQVVTEQKNEYEQQLRTMKFQSEQLKQEFEFVQQSHQAQYHKQQQDIERLNEELIQANQGKSMLEGTMKTKNQSNQELQNRLRAAQDQLDQLQLRNQELTFDMESRQQQHMRELDKLQGQQQSLENQNKQLKIKLQESEGRIQETENEFQNIQVQFQNNEEVYEQQLMSLRSDKQGLESQIKQLRIKYDSLDQQFRNVQIELEQRNKDFMDQERQMNLLQRTSTQEKQQLEMHVKDIDVKYRSSKATVEELEMRIVSYEEQTSEFRSQIQLLEADIENWTQRYQDMEYEFTILTEKCDGLERFQMSNKDWEVRFMAERAALETQIMQLKAHEEELKMTNSQQARENKRLEQLSTERLVEIEKLKQLVSNAQHTQNEYDELSKRYEEVQNECFDLQQEKLKFNSTKNSLEKQIKRLEEEVKNKEQEREESYSLIKKHRDDAENAHKEKEQLRREVHKVSNTVQDRDSTIQLNQERIMVLERENEDLSNQVDSLKRQTAKMESEIRQRQQELQDKLHELDMIKAKYEDNWTKLQQQPQPRMSISHRTSTFNAPNPMESPHASTTTAKTSIPRGKPPP